MLNKEQVYKYADDLGIDISNMKWHEALSTVSKALNERNENNEDEVKQLKEQLEKQKARVKELEVKHEKRAPGRAPTHEESKQEIVITPEIRPNQKHYPSYTYDEELGHDIEYEEAYMDLKTFSDIPEDTWGANYKIRGKKRNKVVAKVDGPRQNAGVSMDPTKHVCAVAHMQGCKPGYVYASPVYYDVKDLISSVNGEIYIDKYRKEITRNQYYVGPFICLPIPFVHNLLRKIELEEKQRQKLEGEYGNLL